MARLGAREAGELAAILPSLRGKPLEEHNVTVQQAGERGKKVPENHHIPVLPITDANPLPVPLAWITAPQILCVV